MRKFSHKQYCYLASFYDRLMNQEKYLEWGKLIKRAIKKYRVSKKICLDIACGTGKITGILLKQGFEVIGIDRSKEMLKIARKNFPKAKFVKANMRNFKLEERGVLAVSFYDSLNYLLTKNDLLKTFRAISHNLEKGAIFLFDLNSQVHITYAQKKKPEVAFGQDFYAIFNNSGTGKFWFLEIDLFIKQKNGLYKLFREKHVERGYAESEVIPLLKRAGFNLLETKSDKRANGKNQKYKSRLYFITRKK